MWVRYQCGHWIRTLSLCARRRVPAVRLCPARGASVRERAGRALPRESENHGKQRHESAAHGHAKSAAHGHAKTAPTAARAAPWRTRASRGLDPKLMLKPK
jgi:hypothetical protein